MVLGEIGIGLGGDGLRDRERCNEDLRPVSFLHGRQVSVKSEHSQPVFVAQDYFDQQSVIGSCWHRKLEVTRKGVIGRLWLAQD